MAKRIKKMTDRDLWMEFQRLNERFFQDKIVLNRIAFSNRLPAKNVSGVYNTMTKSILIDPGLRNYWVIVTILLLHEMTHAYQDVLGYKGYPGDQGHGSLFHVEIGRLYQAGAYDSLL
jgi:hypothetical protein